MDFRDLPPEGAMAAHLGAQRAPAPIEPGTVADTDDGHCLHSIAISLKRIADMMEHETRGDRRPCNGSLERFCGFCEACKRQLEEAAGR